MFISERLALAASLYPGAPALIRHGERISYGELHRLADKLGNAMYAEGLRPGDRLAIIGEPDPRLVIALYAAAGIGVIPLVPSPLLTAYELTSILEDAEPSWLIHDDRYADTAISASRMLANPPKLISAEEDATSHTLQSLLRMNAATPPEGFRKQRLDEVAVLIYTGGTTGRPKGVMHSHRGLASWNQFTPAAGFGYDPERRVLVLNLSHLVGQFQLWATMAAGGSLVFLDDYPSNVHRLIEAVERDRISHLSTVGQLLRDFTREASGGNMDLSSLKVIGCGGSVLSADTLRETIARFPGVIVVNNYTQAECGMSISRSLPSQHIDHPARIRSVGRPSDLAAQGEKAFQVKIVKEDGVEAAIDEPGEIVVRGEQTMIGYWRQPDKTAEVMQDGWIRTGDIGCLDAEGFLFVLDRLKDMVIVNGSNVFCAEVEQAIESHERIADVAVIGLPLPGEGEELAACIVLRGDGGLELESLRDFCEPKLAIHKRPTRLFLLDSLPRTAVDKVDKKALRRQARMS